MCRCLFRSEYLLRPAVTPRSDDWWYWKQAEACVYELPPGGLQPTHDDRLLCAALVALCDELVAAGELRTGRAQSQVIPLVDPLDDLTI